MAPPPLPADQGAGSGSTSKLIVRFESLDELRSDYSENIATGALFLPTVSAYAPRQEVDIVLDLAFCGQQLTVPAEVVAVVDPALAEVGATQAGISVRLTDPASALRDRLEAATGVYLETPDSRALSERRRVARSHSDADVVITTPDGEFAGTTANVSYTGVLALIPMVSIPAGTDVSVHLANPMVELELTVGGRVIHNRRCDDGAIAHGIQLHYPADRIEEVMAFIEFLQSFDRARRLATVSGAIDESGVSSVLDMFVNTAPSGTLSVFRGKDVGRIVFSENYILRCTVGMVSGMKALARMFRWTDGRFEFHHDLQLPETPDDPQPYEAAMMVASIQVDEMARIGVDAFGATDAFEIHPEPVRQHRDALTDLEREVLDYAAEGFNVAAISDMITAPDAEIFKSLVVLLDLGMIGRRS